jgi:hypothetical protein
MKATKKKQTKNAGKTRKASKSAPVATSATTRTRERDPRLPAAGTVITRHYKGKDYKVTVLEDGFRYDGKEFRSLSALASEITGAESINGFLWWKLTERPAATKSERKTPKSKGKGDASAGTAPVAAATPDAASV